MQIPTTTRHVSTTLLLIACLLKTSVSQQQQQQGECDADLCACILPYPIDATEAPQCPPWMVTTGDGGPYSTVLWTVGCPPFQGKDGWVFCNAYSNFYQNPRANLTSSCPMDDDERFLFLDGDEVILDYTWNTTDEILQCSSIVPFSNSPTSSPTVSIAPSAAPTEKSASSSVSMVDASLAVSFVLGVLFYV